MMDYFSLERFNFKANRGCDSVCRLDVLKQGLCAVIMLTELDDNPGVSVTNAFEEIATELVEIMGVWPDKCFWIEHYPQRSYGRDTVAETFDQVTMTWDEDQKKYKNIQWRSMRLEEVPNDFKGITL